MLELNKVTVVIEPDADEQPALHKAKQVAKLADCELELLLAEYNSYLEDGYYFDPVQAQKLRYEHGDRRMEELQALADSLREQGLEVSCTTAWGNPPHLEIVSRIKESKPGLVIKSTRHHSNVARLLLSNEDWELVRYCPVPLLLVKSQDWSREPVFVAAVDPDHQHDKPAALDNKLIATAQTMARLAEGSVHLYHSSWVPPLSGVYPLVTDADAENQKLSELAERFEVSPDNCHWSNEEISHGLPTQVQELGASVVVMGAVSRSRLDRLLVGNTAERVMDNLECDVLVVKPVKMPALNQILVQAFAPTRITSDAVM